ncbi:hypothetical protein [Lewinella sp. 4G2]|uniref:hypothetical protein n=1 Tax=Lewinella sp. 4G2 TaxID=1803372 RepID=UPI0007B46114|nr:hypothetical protein [Lewinella sp. 4G2]OAV44080.1 hypothetical protein A3850_006020 [Lewinella sp. 4G2]
MLIYGSRARHGETFKLKELPCAHCEQTESQTMSFFTRYGYLYWIPFIPLDKVSVTECDHCKRTSGEEDYTNTLHSIKNELAPRVENPKWYWAGSIAVVGLFAVFMAIGAWSSAADAADYRSGLLKADVAEMTNTPSLEADSVSYYIDQFMTAVMPAENGPDDFYYKTKHYGSNILVLMSIPELGDYEDREEIMPSIVNIVESIEDTDGKNMYYGIMNNSDRFMLVKSPQDSSYSSFADKDLLYPFYGEPME